MDEARLNALSTDRHGLPAEQGTIRNRCFHPTGTFIEFQEAAVEQGVAMAVMRDGVQPRTVKVSAKARLATKAQKKKTQKKKTKTAAAKKPQKKVAKRATKKVAKKARKKR